jgi:hypothetical protein
MISSCKEKKHSMLLLKRQINKLVAGAAHPMLNKKRGGTICYKKYHWQTFKN